MERGYAPLDTGVRIRRTLSTTRIACDRLCLLCCSVAVLCQTCHAARADGLGLQVLVSLMGVVQLRVRLVVTRWSRIVWSVAGRENHSMCRVCAGSDKLSFNIVYRGHMWLQFGVVARWCYACICRMAAFDVHTCSVVSTMQVFAAVHGFSLQLCCLCDSVPSAVSYCV